MGGLWKMGPAFISPPLLPSQGHHSFSHLFLTSVINLPFSALLLIYTYVIFLIKKTKPKTKTLLSWTQFSLRHSATISLLSFQQIVANKFCLLHILSPWSHLPFTSKPSSAWLLSPPLGKCLHKVTNNLLPPNPVDKGHVLSSSYGIPQLHMTYWLILPSWNSILSAPAALSALNLPPATLGDSISTSVAGAFFPIQTLRTVFFAYTLAVGVYVLYTIYCWWLLNWSLQPRPLFGAPHWYPKSTWHLYLEVSKVFQFLKLNPDLPPNPTKAILVLTFAISINSTTT